MWVAIAGASVMGTAPPGEELAPLLRAGASAGGTVVDVGGRGVGEFGISVGVFETGVAVRVGTEVGTSVGATSRIGVLVGVAGTTSRVAVGASTGAVGGAAWTTRLVAVGAGGGVLTIRVNVGLSTVNVSKRGVADGAGVPPMAGTTIAGCVAVGGACVGGRVRVATAARAGATLDDAAMTYMDVAKRNRMTAIPSDADPMLPRLSYQPTP